MICIEKSLKIPFTIKFKEIEDYISDQFPNKHILRFITTHFDNNYFYANLLVGEGFPKEYNSSVFSFSQREFFNQKNFNICFLIPTGIGCEIGGHAGDGTAALKLLASSCDKVITHPNVVNASDLNEMPENTLYIEGSHLTQFLMGAIGFNEVKSNRILAIIEDDQINNRKFESAAINSVNAARAVLGIEADICVLNPSMNMKGVISNNIATGEVTQLENLYELLLRKQGSFDAVAITSKIHIDENLHKKYSQSNGQIVNPWGAVEAMLTHFISSGFGVPSAHAPMFENDTIANLDFGVVDARIAPEIVSTTFFHCVLKGLHTAPRIIHNNNLLNQIDILSAKDISAIVIPDGVFGIPVLAALHQNIKVIAVKNNNSMKNDLLKLPWNKGQFYQCNNYLEASGILNCIKSGLSASAVRRPFKTLNQKIHIVEEAVI